MPCGARFNASHPPVRDGRMRDTMMICESCGAEISREALACPHCGHAYHTLYATHRRIFRRTIWGYLPVSLILLGLLVWAVTR
jgi:predicted RNA-binding Zn-ribbon protein involved in translation (DUF1610 family)